MAQIERCDLPEGALLRRYLGEGGYADCYCIDVASTVSQAGFV